MAEEKKSERIKLFIVIGLAVAAGTFGYFRFFHKKAPATPTAIPGVTLSPVSSDLRVPKIDFASILKKPSPKPADSGERALGIRDVFSSLRILKQFEGEDPEPQAVPAPTFKLSGTILGGGSPVAIINSKFLRKGDEINGFQVVEIAKNEVRLSDGNQEIVLKVLEKL